MPVVLIEVSKKYSPAEETSIMQAVHSAVVDAFKILPDDRNIKFIVHEPHRLMCPGNLQHPELYTLISIDCFSGRSLEAKRNLYRAIVENLEALNIPRDCVKILLHEIPKENWGIRGGQAACDVELGYKVEV